MVFTEDSFHSNAFKCLQMHTLLLFDEDLMKHRPVGPMSQGRAAPGPNGTRHHIPCAVANAAAGFHNVNVNLATEQSHHIIPWSSDLPGSDFQKIHEIIQWMNVGDNSCSIESVWMIRWYSLNPPTSRSHNPWLVSKLPKLGIWSWLSMCQNWIKLGYQRNHKIYRFWIFFIWGFFLILIPQVFFNWSMKLFVCNFFGWDIPSGKIT